MAAPPEQTSEVFVGREKQLAVRRSALDQPRTRQPQVVLIEGPAGIGKTALVDHVLAFDSDVQVLRASGEPWEALAP
jgi:Holliday junction resolvasome RuvABC ATP-dependent DNA helicase subunit